MYPSTGYLPRLYQQWQNELADRPATYPDGTPWAQDAPALAGVVTLGGVLEVLDGGCRQRTDAVLHALLVLAAAGQELAARTVFQAMLPAVQRQGRTARFRRLEDPLSCAGAAMWDAIATYPLHRQGKVAANLAMEALRRLQASVETPLPIEDAGAVLDADLAREGGCGGSQATDLEAAAAAIAWALDQGVLAPEEARLLARVHLAERTPSMSGLAEEFGVSAAALRQRHSRAVRRLAAGVRDRLGCPSPEDVVAVQRLTHHRAA